MSNLAILGGEKAVKVADGDMFTWPIVNREMEAAVLDVLRRGAMSGTDVTKKFEREYADWYGVKYALAHNNGTASIQTAMFGVGLKIGDEIISPTITYWATCLQALSLGVRVIFADINPISLCIDPDDIERKITPKTKAIMVVHYLGHPADMDSIMAIAQKHNLKVIEDASHSHGSIYKGKMAGTFGDAAGFSLMSAKGFAIGEGGILLTDDRTIYERAILFGHYIRHDEITIPELKKYSGLPWGGYKYRMHQISAAVGREQLKKFPAEMEEIDRAMKYFWKQLEGLPGIKPHCPGAKSGSTMGAWYCPHGHYVPEELDGLSVERFCEAVAAEGTYCIPGCNPALHKHPIFSIIDVYGEGKSRNCPDVPEDELPINQHLPVAEGIQSRVFSIPWFKHFRKDVIEQHVAAFRKTVESYKYLIPGDNKKKSTEIRWGLSSALKK
ncbi:MAG: hypothetical protein A2X48_12970 [Lentisphaerae bacterium GWF2_49_21]|nr:MAG: hypothetical protein A2X48_12970 [Lentisphaerae bacterium GWF2_49_21]